MPLVSVIIPLFNGGKYIERTLQSVFMQTFRDFEVIVVDDGSLDNGLEIVKAFAMDKPDCVKYLTHAGRKNRGIAASKNAGIRRARGEFIAFIDQDDIWNPVKLETQVVFLQDQEDVSLTYSRVGIVLGEQDPYEGHISGFVGHGKPHAARNMFSELLKENYIPALTVVARKEHLLAVGLFDESAPLHHYEDWLLWSKLAYSHKFYFVPDVLGYYRSHHGSVSAQRLSSGDDFLAEEHYIVALFHFLLNSESVNPHIVHRHLLKRIWLFFLRGRSWGVSAKKLRASGNVLVASFPTMRSHIEISLRLASLIPSSVAGFARQVRRKLKG